MSRAREKRWGSPFERLKHQAEGRGSHSLVTSLRLADSLPSLAFASRFAFIFSLAHLHSLKVMTSTQAYVLAGELHLVASAPSRSRTPTCADLF